MSIGEWMKKAHKKAGWLVALGVLQIVLGVLVLVTPLAGGLAVTMMIGFAMVLGGVARLIASFAADSFGSGALAFLWGLLLATGGFYMFTNPGLGLAGLTLMLSMMFFVSGLTESVVAFQVKPDDGWGWMLTGGIVSVILAIMVWRQFPVSGVWLIGTVVAVHLLMSGFTTLMIGTGARKVTARAD